MPDPTPPRPPASTIGGGFPLIAAIIGGTAIGLVVGQPTIGFLAGAGVGAAILALMWWRQRR